MSETKIEPKPNTEAADKAAEQQEIENKDKIVVDPDKLKPDREILRFGDQGNLLEVTNPRPDRAYRWENPWGSGRFITKKKAQGWKLVKGDDKECEELKDPQGYRRIGDLLLMWIPRQLKEKLDENMARRRQLRKNPEVALGDARDFARKAGRYMRFHEGQSALDLINRRGRPRG